MPRRSNRLRSLAAPTFALAAMALATGCTSQITSGDIRSNPSPELYTTAKTAEENRNDIAQVLDWNARTLRDDVNRLLLIDRPSRLTIYPAP